MFQLLRAGSRWQCLFNQGQNIVSIVSEMNVIGRIKVYST